MIREVLDHVPRFVSLVTDIDALVTLSAAPDPITKPSARIALTNSLTDCAVMTMPSPKARAADWPMVVLSNTIGET